MLSIVIVNYKNPEMLRLCLQSIQNAQLSIPNETIVVDSASSRKTQDIVYEEFPSVKIIPHDKNTGYSIGVNSGIKASKGDYLLIINPDLTITKGSIEKLISYLDNNPSVGLVGPRLLNFDGSLQYSCRKFYTPLTVLSRRTPLGTLSRFKKLKEDALMQHTDLSHTQEVDWLMGSALLTKREYIDIVGMMDERFFMYFEDMDFSRRFWHAGYSVVYYPEATFYHYHGRASKTRLGIFDAFFNKQTHWHINSAIKYFSKWI